jgi:uncharacterized RmlC-like cupin family protein
VTNSDTSDRSATPARLHHVKGDELSSNTAQTPGMVRRQAVSGATTGANRIWMGDSRMTAGANSGDHHHGESETAIYVAAGNPVFVFAENGRERRIETEPGDYVFVPPFVRHREENPSENEAVVVLARSTQDAIVVNVDSLVEGDG